jgi:hypothetical protein
MNHQRIVSGSPCSDCPDGFPVDLSGQVFFALSLIHHGVGGRVDDYFRLEAIECGTQARWEDKVDYLRCPARQWRAITCGEPQFA